MRGFTLIIALVVGLTSLPSCTSLTTSPDLVFKRSADPKVQNGTAYERGVVDIGGTRTVVLPEDAVVRRCQTEGRVKLYMAKTLGYMGHPPKSKSIREEREVMGCAVKVDGESLVIATYGEWDCIEGGTSVKLVAMVPNGLAVEQRKGLSGRDSSTLKDWQAGYLGRVKNPQGWQLVCTVPDPARTADALDSGKQGEQPNEGTAPDRIGRIISEGNDHFRRVIIKGTDSTPVDGEARSLSNLDLRRLPEAVAAP
ncbi:MAG: hypothetical protein C0467_31985 [Planctomycetaceae bacterium]|nr:hypothetical protein [Planctomycetaceae bacterium]